MKIFLAFVAHFLLSRALLLASPLEVDISAKGAILINSETGAVLWEKNAHTALFPASTTKVITALYAMEKKGHALDEMVTASSDAVLYVASSVRRAAGGAHPPYRLEFGGTHMGLKPGETLPLRVLLYGLMLPSGNDAANVIAQHVSGNIPTFMEELNRFVREKGCKNTVLYTPHGLPCEGHKISAFDMAILAREFLKHNFLREMVKATEYPRPPTNKQPESILRQHNALVRPGKFFYPKATGIKIGYTDAAGHTLVSAAEDQNRKLIAVLFGTEKLEQRQRYNDAMTLFEAAFNEKKVSRTLLSKGFDLFSHPIKGGNIPLQASLAQDMVLEYYPSEEPVFKTAVLWQELALPIASGQKVGEIRVASPQGVVLASASLYAVRNVGATLFYRTHLIGAKVKKGIRDHVTLVMATLGILILAGTFYYARRPKITSHTER